MDTAGKPRDFRQTQNFLIADVTEEPETLKTPKEVIWLSLRTTKPIS